MNRQLIQSDWSLQLLGTKPTTFTVVRHESNDIYAGKL